MMCKATVICVAVFTVLVAAVAGQMANQGQWSRYDEDRQQEAQSEKANFHFVPQPGRFKMRLHAALQCVLGGNEDSRFRGELSGLGWWGPLNKCVEGLPPATWIVESYMWVHESPSLSDRLEYSTERIDPRTYVSDEQGDAVIRHLRVTWPQADGELLLGRVVLQRAAPPRERKATILVTGYATQDDWAWRFELVDY